LWKFRWINFETQIVDDFRRKNLLCFPDIH
jgi:hypothetical protein